MASSLTEDKDNEVFLNSVRNVLKWTRTDLKNEVVMDIGCGAGKTAMTLVENFPLIKQVIAVDMSETELQHAERLNAHPKILYKWADIRCLSRTNSVFRPYLNQWVGKMDKAVSVFCFNYLKNTRYGYKAMYDFLKPGGEGAIVQTLQSGYFAYLLEMKNSRRWKHLFQDGIWKDVPKCQSEGHTAAQYKEKLERTGFEIVSCYEEMNTYAHIFDHDGLCKDLLSAEDDEEICQILPKRQVEKFKEEAFAVFQKHNKRDEYGKIMMEHRTFSAFVRKPAEVPPEPEEE